MKVNVALFVAGVALASAVARYIEERKIKNDVRRVIAHANRIAKEAA